MNLDPDRVPDNLTMAIAIFIAGLSDDEKWAFRNMSEDELAILHPTIGAALRNDWSLWEADTRLMVYFRKFHVAQPDDVSALVIQAAWRVLNNRPLAAEDLLRPYQKP